MGFELDTPFADLDLAFDPVRLVQRDATEAANRHCVPVPAPAGSEPQARPIA